MTRRLLALAVVVASLACEALVGEDFSGYTLAPPPKPCDATDPMACDAGLGCRVVNANPASQCFSAGALQAGVACSAGECAPSLTCLADGTAIVGSKATSPVCRQYCRLDGSGAACPMGYPCTPIPGSTNTTYGACGDAPCDPVLGTCPSGDACLLLGTPICGKAGSLGQGKACATTPQCAPGYVCVTSSTSANAECQRVCHSDSDCPGSFTCGSFNPPVYVDLREVGSCS